ncbi:MAG: DHH family phosphoesterase [Clostridia bacterium]|nr:DHH family phosphoesterase [Clostridia bacterium]
MRKIEKLQDILKPYDKITIIGHENIDVDAFLSGVLLSHLLDFLHISNEFLILEEIEDNETYQIIKEVFKFTIEEYCSKKEDISRKLFLEDHYKTKHAGEVIACLDHHPTKDLIEYPFYYSRISCSTSYMVYELMQEAGYKISQEEAKMIIVSMMIDTVSFRSTKTVKEEAIKAKEIAEQYELNYEEIEKYCLCLTPINNIPVYTIINNGYKFYDYNGKRVKSSYIQIYEMIEEEKIIDWIQNIMKIVEMESLAMWVFIIFECKHEITYEYHITQNSIKREVSKGILSRGTNIMPKIEELFQK